MLAVVGARGAILEVCAPPLSTVTVGAGTLAAVPPEDERAGLARYLLGSHEGHTTLARLFLDGPEDAMAPVVRGLELVVDAAWSRAEVHGRAERLAALEAATRAVAAELDIDRVLGVIVDRVRELVGARFSALGVADATGRIERFITSGISPQARAAIGAAPRGHGLLGAIIRDGRIVRAEDIARDPRRYGFPPHHPVMTSFLGAPVMVKGRSVGNLYLSDKLEGEPFSEDDEHLVEMFAVHAGIAIENARLHDLVQRLAIVEERERIGKDLHDGIIQAIYAVGLSLEDVPELVEDEDGRRDAVARVDRAIDALNLVDLGHPFLHPATPAGHGRAGGPRRGPRAPGRGTRDARRHRPRGRPRRRRGPDARAAAGPPVRPAVHRARGPLQRRPPCGRDQDGARPRARRRAT